MTALAFVFIGLLMAAPVALVWAYERQQARLRWERYLGSIRRATFVTVTLTADVSRFRAALEEAAEAVARMEHRWWV